MSIAYLESLLTPTAFVVSLSVFVSTVVLASDHTTEAWFHDVGNLDLAYTEYAIAHAVTPILFALVLWTTYESTFKFERVPQRFANALVCTAASTILIEVWSSLFNPDLVYHTKISQASLLLTFACTAIGASAFAVFVLGARPLYHLF